MKILDARTLGTIQQFSVIQSIDASISNKGNLSARASGPSLLMKSNSSNNRPRSASATPGSRLQHRPQGIKIRPALDTPKHAAGGGSASKTQDDSAGAVIGGAGMRGAATDKDDDDAHSDGAGSKVVTGIAIVKGLGRTSAQATYILAALGNGKLVRVECGSAIIGALNLTPRPTSANNNNMAVASEVSGKELFHFHTGPVYGLAADTTQENRLFATVCDDRKLIVWDAQDCVMIGKATTQVGYILYVTFCIIFMLTTNIS